MPTIYLAALMDAETGGSQGYTFEGDADLFRKPAHDIVDAFIDSLRGDGGRLAPLDYELNSAIKKQQKQVVMATGSLIFSRGEIPFLVMISPAARTVT